MTEGWQAADVCWRRADEGCGGSGGSGFARAPSQDIALASDQISLGGIGDPMIVKEIDNNSGGAITLTSAPNIAPGSVDGQILLLRGANGMNSVTIRDVGVQADSGLRLASSANKTITTLDSIMLQWDTADNRWVQVTTLQSLA